MMPLYEYRVIDIGCAGTGLTVDELINRQAEEGWRLIAVVQRVGNNSNAIRHYFERVKS